MGLRRRHRAGIWWITIWYEGGRLRRASVAVAAQQHATLPLPPGRFQRQNETAAGGGILQCQFAPHVAGQPAAKRQAQATPAPTGPHRRPTCERAETAASAPTANAGALVAEANPDLAAAQAASSRSVRSSAPGHTCKHCRPG